MLIVVTIIGALATAIAIGYGMLRQQEAKQAPIVAPAVLIIAHPDDESMFFVPTLARLCRSTTLHLLCLSTGDSAGLGKVRIKELESAAKKLGLGRTPVVIDDPNLQDGMDQHWPASVIRSYVDEYVQKHHIKSIITFDGYGVSGHRNHVAICQAISQHLSSQANVYLLDSLPLWRKYIGPLNFLFEASHVQPSDLVFVSSNPWLSYQAMKQHWSQFVWFRHLFVIFSSYTFVNRLKPITS